MLYSSLCPVIVHRIYSSESVIVETSSPLYVVPEILFLDSSHIGEAVFYSEVNWLF